MSSDNESEESVFDHDFDDLRADHHFGMEHDNAGGPYSNRGRTELVWKILNAYGFRRTTDANGKAVFADGDVPTQCFEREVRLCASRSGKDGYDGTILESGEMAAYTVSSLAKRIRSSHHIDEMDQEQKQQLENMSDADLVREALSGDLLMIYYYSFLP